MLDIPTTTPSFWSNRNTVAVLYVNFMYGICWMIVVGMSIQMRGEVNFLLIWQLVQAYAIFPGIPSVLILWLGLSTDNHLLARAYKHGVALDA